MQYYLNYDQSTGLINASYCDVVNGKIVPVYNTEPITTQVAEIDENGNAVLDEEGNPVMQEVTQEIGTVQTGTTLDLSAIPQPYTAISDAEHDEWMQNQSTRKIDIDTKKLVEYTPPEQPPVVITPSVSQDLADVWEAIFALSEAKEGGN